MRPTTPNRRPLDTVTGSASSRRTAAIGAGLDDRFEIGSISRGLTGLLLADMIGRGEVTADTRVGDLVPVDGPVAEVTLAQLATHHSSLPIQPSTVRQLVRNQWSQLSAGNPHNATLALRLAELADVDLDAAPATYSNVGFELLGAALAAAGGAPYPQLLAERVLTQVGMDDTIVPVSAAELGPATSWARPKAAAAPTRGSARH